MFLHSLLFSNMSSWSYLRKPHRHVQIRVLTLILLLQNRVRTQRRITLRGDVMCPSRIPHGVQFSFLHASYYRIFISV